MPPPYAEPRLVMPCAGVISGRFLQRGNGYPDIGHLGVDIANDEGTLLVASYGGPVVPCRNDGGFGIAVCIDYRIPENTRWYGLAAHMSKALVSVGDVVQQGQPIGLMGSTGKASGPHVHWALCDTPDFPLDPSRYADPLQYLVAAAEPPIAHVGRPELAEVLEAIATGHQALADMYAQLAARFRGGA